MTNSTNAGSGDGTRPTTDGGVDNIGAADSFKPGQGSENSPPPREKMSEVKKDKASVKEDDSAPMGLPESTHSTPNTENPESSPGRSS